MRIIIALSLLLISACTQANSKCLGSDQLSTVARYECLSNNAFVALSEVGKHLDNELARVKLYKLDGELTLSSTPPDYVISITSLDIGEPVVILGLKTNQSIRLNLNSQNGFDLVDTSGQQQFRIVFNGYEDISVNGVTF
ncbi:hypothetical protein [Paraferrimonas sp. SM1919]|uniref:hypothetical protein n=1 Tax=Paraferrimonas sp. SM1919 TaxID=2662263 RepID=UPI0013D80C32|nr:hypothetical protein [Paraferrimonas sp. SM1919]